MVLTALFWFWIVRYFYSTLAVIWCVAYLLASQTSEKRYEGVKDAMLSSRLEALLALHAVPCARAIKLSFFEVITIMQNLISEQLIFVIHDLIRADCDRWDAKSLVVEIETCLNTSQINSEEIRLKFSFENMRKIRSNRNKKNLRDKTNKDVERFRAKIQCSPSFRLLAHFLPRPYNQSPPRQNLPQNSGKTKIATLQKKFHE